MKAHTLSWYACASILLLVLAPQCHASRCDEAQCRGRRAHPWVLGDTEYTCWVQLDVTAEELADPANEYCTEGYVGRLVDEEERLIVDGEARRWYTCCPIDYEGEALRTCSDSTCSSPDWAAGGNCWADGFQEPMSCGTRDMRHPRYTGLQSLIYIQFLCCDAPASNDSFMQELLAARVIWVLLSAITLVACSIFVAAILLNNKARKQGYNMYLVFLAIPDALANIMVLVRNGLSIPGAPVSPNVYIFLASFEYFYAAANMWLNAVIVAEIHRVLSRRFSNAGPPSVRLACQQAGVTYFFACAAFGWAFFMYHNGLLVFSLTTVVNIWIATRALLAGPPLLYVLFVCFDVWRRNLLPISGRTRVVALYFLRVVIVFLVTWVPYFIIYEIAWNITFNRWQVNCSYYLGSVQGLISVIVAMSKPDVKRAVEKFLRCDFPADDEDDSSKRSGPSLIGLILTFGIGRSNNRRIGGGKTAEEHEDFSNEWEEDDIWEEDDVPMIRNNDKEITPEEERMEQGQKSVVSKPSVIMGKSDRTGETAGSTMAADTGAETTGESSSDSTNDKHDKDDDFVLRVMNRVRTSQNRRIPADQVAPEEAAPKECTATTTEPPSVASNHDAILRALEESGDTDRADSEWINDYNNRLRRSHSNRHND